MVKAIVTANDKEYKVKYWTYSGGKLTIITINNEKKEIFGSFHIKNL